MSDQDLVNEATSNKPSITRTVIIVVTVLITTVGSNWGASAYFKGSSEVRLQHLEESMKSKVDNVTLLQYIKKQQELQTLRDKLFANHITYDAERIVEIKKDIEKLEQWFYDFDKEYPTEAAFRGKKKTDVHKSPELVLGAG